jgi:hypothetical protein
VKLRLTALAAGALAVSGCAMSPQLQRVAIDHNAMVADTENELTLLNIVRASHRFPLHFTAFSEVTGDASISVGGSLGAGWESGPDSFSSGISAGASTSPGFRLGVLSTEKFQRGIQQPIGSDLVAYYLDAGWRDELIMALLIERVDFTRPGQDEAPVLTITNEPESNSDFAKIICSYRLTSVPTAASRPLARFDQLFDQKVVDDRSKSAGERRTEIANFLDLLGRDDLTFQGETVYLKGTRHSADLERLDSNRCASGASFTPPAGNLEARPRFRSALGIIYFLGEYSRQTQRAGLSGVYRLPFTDDTCGHSLSQRPLIDIRTGSGAAYVDADFRGERYYVPDIDDSDCSNHDAARSMQVIALVQQVLNLQKSADDLPASISVTGLR